MDLGQNEPHDEICGALLGNRDKGDITTYIPLTNISPTKSCHYIPDPNEWLQVLKKTTFLNKKSKWDLIGLFHTHPHCAPIASSTDINEAGYEGLYWIYSPKDNSSNFYYYDGSETTKKFKKTRVVITKENDNAK